MDNYLPNPYSGQDFFGFFNTLFTRLFSLFSGPLQLFSDEIQLLTIIPICLSCVLVGSFLVFRKKTMVANALSHTILFGIVIAFLLFRVFNGGVASELMSVRLLIFAALFSAFLTTFFTEFFIQKFHLQEDVSIGMIFTLFFAAGVILLTLFARNAHLGTELVMGSVDALQIEDALPVYKILLVNSLIFILFFKEYKITAFDPSFARLIGIGPAFFHYLLMVQTSLVSMFCFQAVGVVMVLAFFVAPVLTMRLLTNRLVPLIFGAMGLSLIASLMGLALARHLVTYYQMALSTGGLIVCMLFFIYIIVFLIYLLRLRRKKLTFTKLDLKI